MKISLATAAAVLATGAQACIRISTFQWNSGIGHGSMSIQLRDNSDFYCEASQNKAFPSASTVWSLKCPNGDYWVTLWDNGGSGRVERVGVWKADLHRRSANSEQECIAWSENTGRCLNYVTQYEYTLDDNFGNC